MCGRIRTTNGPRRRDASMYIPTYYVSYTGRAHREDTKKMFKKRQKRGAFDASDVIREKHRSTRVFCDVVPLSHPLSLSRRYCCAIYFRFVFSLSRYVGSRVGNGESGRRACVRHSGFLLFFSLRGTRRRAFDFMCGAGRSLKFSGLVSRPQYSMF